MKFKTSERIVHVNNSIYKNIEQHRCSHLKGLNHILTSEFIQ